MLNNENIQIRIFEYHEGILNAKQKAELMEYLHQHPEWNHEFMVWAQARLHDEPVKAPAFQHKLIKRNGFWMNWGSSLRLSAEVLALCSLTLVLSKGEITQKELPESASVKAGSFIKTAGKERVVAATEKNKYQTTNKIPEDEQNTPHESKRKDVLLDSTVKHTSDLNTVSAIPVSIEEFEPVLYAPVSREPLKSNLTKLPESKPLVKKHKKKYYPKQKFSLRPTSKILPQSKEF